MYEAVGWRRIHRFNYLPYLIDVDLVWKLRPENNARRREFSPDCARGLHAGEFRHLDVEDRNLRFMFQRKLYSFLTVRGFEYRRVRGKLLFQNLTQVVALGHVVFSDQDRHNGD